MPRVTVMENQSRSQKVKRAKREKRKKIQSGKLVKSLHMSRRDRGQ